MSRNSWVQTLTCRNGGWWAIPYDRLVSLDVKIQSSPPSPPWVHTSVARGWPRCSICRAPISPQVGHCPHATGHVVNGDYTLIPHIHYPDYATVAYGVKPRFCKPEKAAHVGPVAPS